MKLQLEDINIEAISLAGFYTCIQLPDFKITFDMGICPRSAINKHHIFFTHCHGDHIAGVIRHCSSREMMRLSPPTYVVGTQDLDNFNLFMDSARKMCRSTMSYNVHAMDPGEHLDIRKDLRVRTYRSVHRVPCQGYILSKIKHKLRPELKDVPRKELIRKRTMGECLTEEIETPLISYTGDTTIDVFKREPQLQNVKVLITEATFLDDKVTKDLARSRGHIHLDDIIEHAHLFTQPAIVLMHFSSRYGSEQIKKLIKKKLPNELYQRIHIIPNDQPLENF
jgi:ribonuclease Z